MPRLSAHRPNGERALKQGALCGRCQLSGAMLETRSDISGRTLPHGPARRVLVIDDSTLVREAAGVGLELAGWAVVKAESGEQGLALAQSIKPDAILLDVVMPGMDGKAVAERLHAGSQASAPIVLLTASDQTEERTRLARLGVAGTIAKPFDVHKLADQVAAVLGWTR